MSSRFRTSSTHVGTASRWAAPASTYGYNTTSTYNPPPTTTRDLYPSRVRNVNDIPDEELYAGQNSSSSTRATAAAASRDNYGSSSTTGREFNANPTQLSSLRPGGYQSTSYGGTSYTSTSRAAYGGGAAGGGGRLMTSSAEPGIRRSIGGYPPQPITRQTTCTPSSNNVTRLPPPPRSTLTGNSTSSSTHQPSYSHTYGAAPRVVSSNTPISSYQQQRSAYSSTSSSVPAPPPTSSMMSSRGGGGHHQQSAMDRITNPITIPPTVPTTTSNPSSSTPASPRLHSPMGSPSSSSVASRTSPLHSPVGFRNLGNTCFMNAALQALLTVPNFITSLNREVTSRGLRTAYLAKDLLELADPQCLSRGPCLQSLKRKVGDRNSEFSSYGQNDGHEFIRTLLLCVHEELNRITGKKPYEELKDDPSEPDGEAARRWAEYHLRRDDSAINDIFAGQKKTVRTCDKCQFRSLNFDPFLDVSLAITPSSQKVDVETLLGNFTGKELLTSSESMFICPSCKKPRDAAQHTTIEVWPQSLVLHFARFTNRGKKINTAVDFDKELKVEDGWGGSSSSRGLPVYSLTGVVVHTGSMDFGHYYAYVRVGSSWYLCDDNSVKEVSSKEALRQDTGAYMLFYSRQS